MKGKVGIHDVYGVIVLYNQTILLSQTFTSLDASLKKADKRLDLLVYDNSFSFVNCQVPEKYNFDITYIHNPLNPGIAEAYNEAYLKSVKLKKKWLLLLDQDTRFDENYVCILEECIVPDGVATIMPSTYVENGKVLISPSILSSYGTIRPLRNCLPGVIFNKRTTGINSGSILSVDFLQTLNGFNPSLPLDMLDHWYFREINRRNRTIVLLSATNYQNLSVFNFQEDVSQERYQMILNGEQLFYSDTIKNFFVYKLKLVVRMIKQISYKNRAYLKLSMIQLFRKKL